MAARIYLGLDPNSQEPEDLAAAEALLQRARPYFRYFNTSQLLNDLASGEVCVAFSWNGYILQARDRGAAAASPVEIRYTIPKEGSFIWFDAVAIPADAPHPDNAHAFLNYLMEPEVIAKVSNKIGYANGNLASAAVPRAAGPGRPGRLSAGRHRALAASRHGRVPGVHPRGEPRVDSHQDGPVDCRGRGGPWPARDPTRRTSPGKTRAAQPYVRLEKLTKKFGDFVAVDDVTLNIYRGEIFCLLGGSGSGKTTLLRMMAGFERPTEGRIWIDGADVTATPPYERPVNMMFQSYALFPHMSVQKNVAFGLRQDKVVGGRESTTGSRTS